MRLQSRSAISYMFRNLWRLIFVSLPIAVFHGFFASYASEVAFVTRLFRGSLDSAGFVPELARSFTVIKYGADGWWIPFVLLFGMSLTQSMFVVRISRHMRMGEPNELSPRKVFSVFPMMLLYMAVIYLCSIVLDFLPVGVAMLLGGLGDGVGVRGAICLVLYFAINTGLAYVFVLLICAFPIRYCDNYPFNAALSYSARIVNKDGKHVALLSLSFSVGQLLVCMMCGLVGNALFSAIVFSLFFLFFVTYIPCVAFSMYYDLIGRERKDISRLIFG